MTDCKSLCGGRTEYDRRCWSRTETDPHGGLGRVLKQFFTKFSHKLKFMKFVHHLRNKLKVATRVESRNADTVGLTIGLIAKR